MNSIIYILAIIDATGDSGYEAFKCKSYSEAVDLLWKKAEEEEKYLKNEISDTHNIYIDYLIENDVNVVCESKTDGCRDIHRYIVLEVKCE